ncbi:MAG: asparaginase [Fidelibacterota bacterium]|nr:MAG: asparaginase [Candidatus Neomarinimicrobiota bacterium]
MSNPIMSFVLRSDRGESVHLTAAVLIDPDGDVAFAAGPEDVPFYLRSAAKPYQAIPLLESGAMEQFQLTEEDLAIACASHSGEARHLEVVGAFQARVGVKPAQLQCGPHLPFCRESEEQLLGESAQPTVLHNNCSGKHTGFLAAAKAMGATLDDYLRPEHPVQQSILAHIQRLIGLDDVPVGIDGCSAPTFFMALTDMARLVQRLAAGDEELLVPQFKAMVKHPFLVGGTGRFDTDFTTVMGGRAVAKEGLEGIQTVAARDGKGRGFGLALKVLDGCERPKAQVALEILHAFELVEPEELEQLGGYYHPVYTNNVGLEIGTLITEVKPET